MSELEVVSASSSKSVEASSMGSSESPSSSLMRGSLRDDRAEVHAPEPCAGVDVHKALTWS